MRTLDPDAHPAVDEATGLRAAYERARARIGGTSVGHHGDVGDIPLFVEAFVAMVEGQPLEELGVTAGTLRCNGPALVLRGGRLVWQTTRQPHALLRRCCTKGPKWSSPPQGPGTDQVPRVVVVVTGTA